MGNGETGCLLLHGLTGTPWSMRELGDGLSREGFSVLAPLLPGHGTSPSLLARVPRESWYEHSRMAYERLKAECKEVFVIGHSMGGALSLLLAARESVQGVILLSTPYSLRLRENVLVQMFRPLIPNWRKRFLRRSALVPEEAGYRVYPLNALHQFIHLLGDCRRELGMVRCPVLIVHARGDRKVPPVNAARIYQALPGTAKRIEWLDDGSHLTTRGEALEIVLPSIVRFIREHR